MNIPLNMLNESDWVIVEIFTKYYLHVLLDCEVNSQLIQQ